MILNHSKMWSQAVPRPEISEMTLRIFIDKELILYQNTRYDCKMVNSHLHQFSLSLDLHEVGTSQAEMRRKFTILSFIFLNLL